MKIKLIAPFSIPFKINNSFILNEDEEYNRFWLEVINKCSCKDASVLFLHAAEEEKLVFTSIKKSTNKNRAEVINLQYEEGYIEKIAKRSSYAATELYDIDKEELLIKIYSNGIGVIETAIIINKDLSCMVSKDFEKLQEMSNEMIVEILSMIYKDSLSCLIDNISSLGQAKIFTVLSRDLGNTSDYAKPRWVNRTLLLDTIDNNDVTRKIISNWIVLDDPEKLLEELKLDKAYCIDWGHNILNLTITDKHYCRQLLDTISLAQFFYTVLFDTNKYLSNIFSEIEKEIKLTPRQLKNRLENDILAVKIFLCLYNDTYISLQGQAHKMFPILSKYWEIDIIIDNIYNKLDICKEKIERYHRNYIKKSQVASEMILLFIGSISLIALLLDLSNFSLNIKYTPHLYELLKDVWIPGIINISILSSPNEMLYLGLAIFFIILFFYKRVLRSKYDE